MSNKQRQKVFDEYFDWQKRLGGKQLTPIQTEDGKFTDTFIEWSIGRLVKLTKFLEDVKPDQTVCKKCDKRFSDTQRSQYCIDKCKNGSEFNFKD